MIDSWPFCPGTTYSALTAGHYEWLRLDVMQLAVGGQFQLKIGGTNGEFDALHKAGLTSSYG